MNQQHQYNRRNFITTMALGAATLPFSSAFSNNKNTITDSGLLPNKRSINIFSKPLVCFGYDELATILSDAGANGIDLSVCPGGQTYHISSTCYINNQLQNSKLRKR